MIWVLTIAAAVAVLISCEPAQPRREAATKTEADLTAEVIDASKAIIAAFGRDDPDTYFELFDAEATFIFHNTPQRLEVKSCSSTAVVARPSG